MNSRRTLCSADPASTYSPPNVISARPSIGLFATNPSSSIGLQERPSIKASSAKTYSMDCVLQPLERMMESSSSKVNTCGQMHHTPSPKFEDSENEDLPSKKEVFESIGSNPVGNEFNESDSSGHWSSPVRTYTDQPVLETACNLAAAASFNAAHQFHLRAGMASIDPDTKSDADNRSRISRTIAEKAYALGSEAMRHTSNMHVALKGSVLQAQANQTRWSAEEMQQRAHAAISDSDGLADIVRSLKAIGLANQEITDKILELTDHLAEYACQNTMTLESTASHEDVVNYLDAQGAVVSASIHSETAQTKEAELMVDLRQQQVAQYESVHSPTASKLSWMPELYVREDKPLLEGLSNSARTVVERLHKAHRTLKKKMREHVANAIAATATASTKALFKGKGDPYAALQQKYLTNMKLLQDHSEASDNS